MVYEVVLHKKVEKEIEDLDKRVAARIILRLRDMEKDPRRGAKHLTGEYYCYWRQRVGKYRIVYSINEESRRVEVVYIWTRGEAYKRKGKKRGAR